MKPGNSLVISLHSVNPEQTLGFCHLVGFKEMSKTDESILLTDGMKLFEIKPSGNNFTSLTYLSDNVKGKKEMALNLELPVEEIHEHEFRFSDPNGVCFAVREGRDEDALQLANKPLSLCGTFSEVSIETNNLDHTVRWYENIGFKVTAKEKPYTTLDDGKYVEVNNSHPKHQNRYPSLSAVRIRSASSPSHTAT